MGFLSTMKKAFTEKGKVGKVAEKTGTAIGRGAGTVYQAMKAQYQKRYGAEGREERIKQMQAKTREARANLELQKIKAKQSELRATSFQNRFGGLVGDRNRNPIEGPNLGNGVLGGSNAVNANKMKRKIL